MALLIAVAFLISGSAIAQQEDEPARDTIVLSKHMTGETQSWSSNIGEDSIVASNVPLRYLIERSLGMRAYVYQREYQMPILGISDAELAQTYDIGGMIERPQSEMVRGNRRTATIYMMQMLLSRHLGIVATREKRKLEDKEIDVIVVKRVAPVVPLD